MTIRALTIHDLAEMFGRSPSWVASNWQRLVKDKKLPPPLVAGSGSQGPSWDAAQTYAMLDKELPAAVRINAAAIRAAIEAASTNPDQHLHHDEIAADRRRMNARFGGAAS